MNKKFALSLSKGFTLIEILIAVTIMGILVGLTLTAAMSSRKVVRDGKRKADLGQIRSALEIYRSDCKTYPATAAVVPGNALTGAEASCVSNVYMDEIPNDPLSGTYSYSYKQITANSYALCSYLETDQSTIYDASICGTICGSACYYKVNNY